MNDVLDLLKREPVMIDADLEILLKMTPAKYAHDHLGYTHPVQEKNYKTNCLALALHATGIKPFTRKSVESYKQAKVEGYNFPTKLSMVALGLLMGSIINMICSAVWGIHMLGAFGVLIGMSIIGSAVIFFVSMGTWLTEGFPRRKIKRWRERSLKGYSDAVPEFALALAQEVHQRCPGVEFSVDELIEEDVVTDPFLVAKYRGHIYYLDVWAEPGYKQERMV